MTLLQHLVYLVLVGIAGYVQNLTGFALGLVLLGLAGLLHVAPVSDVTNAVSVLTLVNAIGIFRASRPQFERAVMPPTLGASLVGVLAGVLLLGWLSDNAVAGLKLLLGLTILGCAVTLAARSTPRATRSSMSSFAAIGLLSGLLGGLFSTAGPPLVYHFYRQPMPMRAIRDALVSVFAINASVRLALMTATGQFGRESLWLSLEAVPLVLLQAHWMTRRPPPWPPGRVRQAVCGLLALIGIGLMGTAISGWR